MRAVTSEQEAKEESETFVAPVLPPLGERLSEDLLFEALWHRVLDPLARGALARVCVLRRPADWGLLRVMANAQDTPLADASVRCLRDCSLLTELRIQGADGRWEPRFEVNPNVAELAWQYSDNAEALRSQGHRLAGEFLEARAQSAPTWEALLEAAFHLKEVGAADRAFELVWGIVEGLQGRGRYLHSLYLLDSVGPADPLSPSNRGWFWGLHANVQRELGSLPEAFELYDRVKGVFIELAEQDPSNATWQRDLSVSYNNVGDILAAQGEASQALSAYQDSSNR